MLSHGWVPEYSDIGKICLQNNMYIEPPFSKKYTHKNKWDKSAVR